MSSNLKYMDAVIEQDQFRRILSAQQVEIFNLLLEGYTVTEIAHRINVGRKVIYRHVDKLRRKYTAFTGEVLQ